MLRFLRLAGIIVFALFVGFSAHALRLMHQSGELCEPYNSRRKSNITLLVFSGISLGVLGYFEMTRFRRLEQRYRYGRCSHRDDADGAVGDRDASSIYAAPKAVDEWNWRRTRGPSVGKRPRSAPIVFWKPFLQVLSLALPITYGVLAVFQLLSGAAGGAEFILWVSVYSFLALFSVLVAIGVFFVRAWGLTCGYLLAIFNLFIFPLGTVAGLLLLIGLVGSSSDFALAEQEKRRKGRRRMEPLLDQV